MQTTQAELLQAMNELGAEDHLQARWRYKLSADGVLEIRVRNGAAGKRSVRLEGAEVQPRAEDKVFQVEVLPAGSSTPAPTLAFQSRQWTDSVRMRALLAHLGRSCGALP